MRLPLPARIGVYFILSGFILDFILFLRGWYWNVDSGVGTFSIFLYLPGMVLLVGTGFFWLIDQWRTRHSRTSLTSPGTQLQPLTLGTEPAAFDPRKLQTFQSASRFSVRAGLGLILFGICLLPSYKHWLATRTFEPFNIPVSLAPGHIKTGDFYINYDDWYFIDIDLDSALPDPNCEFNSVLKVHITLYKNGRALGDDYGPYYWRAGSFKAQGNGNYSLDVETLTDARCLNVRHPRLIVRAARYDSEDWTPYLWWISLLLVLGGVGTILYFIGVRIPSNVAPHASAESYAAINRVYYPQIAKPLPKLFSRLPAFSLVAAVGISWLLFFFLVFGPNPQRGLLVHLVKSHASNLAPSTEPLIVHVQDAGPTVVPKFYVNSKLVSREQLKAEIKTELGRRPEWVVYVQGDNNLVFASVADVIDIARSLQAKVVLVTPQTEFKSVPALEKH